MFIHEGRQVVVLRVVSKIARNLEHVPVRRLGLVAHGIVQLAQVRRRD